MNSSRPPRILFDISPLMGIPMIPNIARCGIYRTIANWGSGLSDREDVQWVGRISEALSIKPAEFDPTFSWAGPESRNPVLSDGSALSEWFYRNLMVTISRRDILSRSRRWLGFRWRNRSGPREAGRVLFQRAAQGGKFVYHMPISTYMPLDIPDTCIPVMNIYDVVPLVFRDTYSDADRKSFDASVRGANSVGSHFIVNAASTKHAFCCFYDIDPLKVHVIQLGCGNPADEPAPATAPKDDQAPFFLYVSSVAQRRKNITSVIKGFSEFSKAQGAGFELKIVGGGTREAVAAASLAGIPSQGVQGLGLVSEAELENLYRTAFCGLYLSIYEGFGLPVLECMRRGLPVICSNVSTMPEVAGDAALLVDPLDPAAIASAMARIAVDPRLREELASASRLRARQFSWKNSTAELIGLYDRLLSA